MRKWWLVAVAVALASGCGPKADSNAKAVSAPTQVTLKAGTPVHLMLMAPLESGDCPVGMLFPMVVSEDVLDSASGAVVIAKGTPIMGEITKTRAAGALSGMLNQPARLEITTEPLSVGGASLKLTAEEGSKEAVSFAFSRDNTGLPDTRTDADPELADALKNEASRKLLSEFTTAVESGVMQEDLAERMAKDPAMNGLFDRLGYARTQKLMQDSGDAKKGFQRILDTAEGLRYGEVSKLGSLDLQLALAAMEEIGGLARDVQNTVRGIFKGRNIRAHVGNRVLMFTMEDATIKLGASNSSK